MYRTAEGLLNKAVENLEEAGDTYSVTVLRRCHLFLEKNPSEETRGRQAGVLIIPDTYRHVSSEEGTDVLSTLLAALSVAAIGGQHIAPWRIHWVRGHDTTVHNQAPDAHDVELWNGLRFRSVSELRIAQALDRTGVLFQPLCVTRVNSPNGRVTREPDFLVCKDGHWGILEVDGEPFHPPVRTVKDHERDRLFRAHGIRVVEHFDSSDCFATPDKVVERFLDLLDHAYQP